MDTKFVRSGQTVISVAFECIKDDQGLCRFYRFIYGAGRSQPGVDNPQKWGQVQPDHIDAVE